MADIDWDSLTEVSIHTTAGGPFEDDVFFVLVGRDGDKTVIPQSDQTAELLQRLQELPGFDNEAFIESMSSVDDATFLVWKAQ